MADETTAPGSVRAVEHLVILIHGINTHALWFQHVESTFRMAGFTVAPIGYGHFAVLRFLWPSDGPKRAAADAAIKKIRVAMKVHRPKKVSIIAHSFGTYIVGRILQEEWDRKWHRIIFCGSVVQDDYPFGQVLDRFETPLLNEIGTNDFWPAIAKSVTWGYGAVGSHGFQDPAVAERWHAGFAHSDFLTPEFCKKYWVPFLRDGEIEEGDRASPLPRWVGFATFFPLRWIVTITLLAALAVPVALHFNVPAVLTSMFIPAPEPDPRLPYHVPLPAPRWERVPVGIQYANKTHNALPIFAEPDYASERLTDLPSGRMLPSHNVTELERAEVNGEFWLRVAVGGRKAYLPEGKLHRLDN